ncbi:MAG TPA: DUF58 domain-containing protein [bacterium]|nr:DUF58 domain-containing protein [bacterium]
MTSESWLLLLAILGTLGAVFHQAILFVFAVIGLLMALASWVWQRACFSGVTYRRLLGQRRAFFNEEVDLTLEVTNRKLLPLPWLEVEDEVPEALTFLDADLTTSYKPRRRTLIHLCSPRWYERIRRRYRVRCAHRGLYEFGPATLRAGDLFGFSTQHHTVSTMDHLIVYPRIVPLERLGLDAQGPFGDLVSPRTLWEDPAYVAGVRPYEAGDSPRRIHWKVSARLGRLRVKILEPTTHPRLALFLDMHTLRGHAWWAGYDPMLVELSIIVAASVAAWGAEHKLPVGLYVNGPRFRRAGMATIAMPPSEHPQQLQAILEALATAAPVATTPLEDLLTAEMPALPWGTSVLAIAAVPEPETIAMLRAARRIGRSAGLVVIGTNAGTVAADDLPVFPVQGEDAWRDLPHVALA